MTTTWRLFDGTAGQTVASPDSSGTAASPSTFLYDSTHVLNGTAALKITPGSGVAAQSRVTSAPLSSPQVAVTVPFWYDALSTADEDIFRIQDNTAGTQLKIISLMRAGSGKLSLTDKSGTSPRLWISPSTTPPISQWLIAKLWIQIGSTATTGSVKLAIYKASDGTMLTAAAGGMDAIFTSAAANLGTVNVGDIWVGRSGGQTTTEPRWFDTVGFDPAATDLLANFVANQAPTANAGPDQSNVAALSTVTLDGSGSSDPEGDPITYSWTQTAGTAVTLSSATAQKPTFTAPAAGTASTLTFQLAVSDGTSTRTDTVSINVLAYNSGGGYSSSSTVWTTYDAGSLGQPIALPADGEAFSTSSGQAAVYDNTHLRNGPRSLKITPVSGQSAFVRQKSGLSTNQIAITMSFWYDSAPTADESIFDVRDTAGATILSLHRAASSNHYRIGAGGANPWVGSNPTVTGAWVTARLRIQIDPANAANGSVKLDLRDASGALIETAWSGVANLGTTAIGSFRVGRTGTSGPLDPFWIDTVGYDITATDVLADLASTASANAGPDQSGIEPYATVTLDGTASTVDSGTKTYSWTQIAGTAVTLSGATTAHPTFTAPATLNGDTLRFQLIVGNGSVNSAPDSVDVAVAAHTIWQIHVIGGTPTADKPIRITQL